MKQTKLKYHSFFPYPLSEGGRLMKFPKNWAKEGGQIFLKKLAGESKIKGERKY